MTIIILHLILLIIGVILTLATGAITFQLIMMMLFGEAPFLSTEKCVRQNIIDTIPLQADSIMYDLGCGNAQILIACREREPKARYIGIEKNIIPYCLARWNVFRYGHHDSITILRRNLFAIDYREATILYAYLFPHTLDLLLPKLKKELARGATVITPTFRFTEKDPAQTISIAHTQRAKALIRKVSLTTF